MIPFVGQLAVFGQLAPGALLPEGDAVANDTANDTANATHHHKHHKHHNHSLNASNATAVNFTLSDQANFSSYRPPCRTSLFGHCEQGGIPSPSPTYRCGRTASFLDPGLATHLVAVLANQTVIEFGAGSGCLAAAIHDTPSGLPVRVIQAYDNRPELFGDTEGLVGFAEPSSPYEENMVG